MHLIAFLVYFGLMGTVCSGSGCSPGCTHTIHRDRQHIRHVSDLGNSSVAPWKLEKSPKSENDRWLKIPMQAVCTTCKVKDMIPKPIYLEISVYEMVRNGSHYLWCRCPHMLSVGCTCVKQ